MGLIITLIILGILLIVAELVLIPGIFVTGILGLCSLGGSCYIAFMKYGQIGGIITVAVVLVLIITFTIIALRSKTWRKITLQTNIDSHIDGTPAEKGIAVGDEGVTITRLNPMGKAMINGKTNEVSTQGSIIDPEKEIVVTLIDDNKVFVKLKQ